MFRHSIGLSQPGRTGNRKASRTVETAWRTESDSGHHPSVQKSHLRVIVVLRDVMRTGSRALDQSSPLILERCGKPACGWPRTCKGAMSRALAPVSVGLHTIETGAARLAQCQAPWAFASIHRRCKSPKTRLYGGTSEMMSLPASDPRSMQDRTSGDVL